MKSKGIFFTAPGVAEYLESETPSPRSDDVVVKIETC